jgi:hypothetical protein
MQQPDSGKARATPFPLLTIAGCVGWGLLYASNHNDPLLFGDLAKTTPAAATAILLVAAGLAMSCRFLTGSRTWVLVADACAAPACLALHAYYTAGIAALGVVEACLISRR